MERELTSQLQPGEENAARIDLDQITDTIWEEMKGQVDKQDIHRALAKILPDYREARILGFVPILMRRDVLEMLVKETTAGPLALPS